MADLYCESMQHANGCDLECEAMAACQLGNLYTGVLKGQGEAMRRKGRDYFKVRVVMQHERLSMVGETDCWFGCWLVGWSV